MPLKEIVKISFVLLPFEDKLPSIANAEGSVSSAALLTLHADRPAGILV